MKYTDRHAALIILTKVYSQKAFLSTELQGKGYSSLTHELCYGVCRQYYRLQAIAKQFIAKQPKEPETWLNILLGLYQIQFLSIPNYAAVQETVHTLELVKKPWAKSLVNAVLRNYIRKQAATLTALKTDLAFQYNHPTWFIKRVQRDWPNNWQEILIANDAHPPFSLRINRLQTSRQTYLEQLHHLKIDATPTTYSPDGITLAAAQDVNTLPGFTAGEVSVQDEAAQLAVSLLDLKPNLRVLDACCAPGGKTCHILETEPNILCLAIDNDARRLVRVKENLQRLQLTAKIVQADASNPQSWWDGTQFDRILLDAPCSATGVIRRHPDIKLLKTPQDITNATVIQQQLLTALWPLLRVGGILVYATCSVVADENANQIKQFIAKHPDCQYIPIQATWGHETGFGKQILPGENNMDGFFYSVCTKV